MAKQTRTAVTTIGTAASAEPVMSARLERDIDKLRQPFAACVREYDAWNTRKADLAKPFIATFKLFQKETKGAFVEFVRLLDPSVPLNRAEYRNHKSYQAAYYLQRVEVQRTKPKPKRGLRPATPLVALARLIATVLPAIDPKGVIWNAFLAELHWSESQAQRLQKLAQHEGPVVDVRKALKLPRRRLTDLLGGETEIEQRKTA